MFLSDRRYLKLRGKLRQILRDSRDRIQPNSDLQKQLAENNSDKDVKEEFFKKYMNGLDYDRAKEFYDAIRNLRQNNPEIPYIGFTYLPNKSKYIISQAELFAKKMTGLRERRLAA